MSSTVEFKTTDKAKIAVKRSILIRNVLIGASVFGSGIISGYGLFYSTLSHRWASFLDEIEMNHNKTVSSLDGLYQKAIIDKQACADDFTRSQEISELKGRLEAQSDLVSSHRLLIDKHQVIRAHLREVETQLEGKDAELLVLQKQIELYEMGKSELETNLQELRIVMQNELNDKSHAIQSLESSIEAFKVAEQNMQVLLKSRHAVLCRQFFGRGPYYVKFSVNLPEQDDSFFLVEISSRKAFPLSVFTFLTLVESGFYNGLDLAIDENGLLKIGGGHSSEAITAERLNSLGFTGASRLYFEEEPRDHPCHDGSISFEDYGPGLIHHIVDHELQYGSCFGQIVGGKDNVVPLIKASLQSGVSLKVLLATVLLDDGVFEKL
jgi:competence protein ComGC